MEYRELHENGLDVVLQMDRVTYVYSVCNIHETSRYRGNEGKLSIKSYQYTAFTRTSSRSMDAALSEAHRS